MVGEIPQSVCFSNAKNGINERHLNRFKATCFGMCLLVKSSVGSSIPQRGLAIGLAHLPDVFFLFYFDVGSKKLNQPSAQLFS